MAQPIRDLKKLEEIKMYLLKKNYRDYLFFKIGINTGLRVSDVRQLKVEDVRENNEQMKDHITIWEQKTQKKKVFRLNNEIQAELQDYIKDMQQEEYIFKSRKGENKPITTVQAWRIITEAGEQCGIQDISTHTMRKTFGYWHYKQYNDIATLQTILNHTSQRETLIYIGIEQDTIDQQYQNFCL